MTIVQTRSLVMTFLVLATALAPSPASARDTEHPWQLRLGLVAMDCDANIAEIGASSDGIALSTGVGGGLGIGIEYRASRRLGLDFGVLAASPDVGTQIEIGWHGVSVSSGITVAPLTIGLNIHVTSGSTVDLYLGPLIAYVAYSGFDLNVGPGVHETFYTSNDLGLGANLGIDVFLGRGRWSLYATVKYIDSTLAATPEGGDTGRVDFDPVVLGFGAGFRF